MMREIYLVTGAAGHLGNAIVNELTSKGLRVRAFVLPNDRAGQRLPQSVEVFTGDLLDKESLQRFFEIPRGMQAIVIHCAGIVTTSLKRRQIVYDVNVTGTKNILEQCLSSNVGKLVYISSVHAIPELPKGQIITEIKDFNPDKVLGPYAKTKAEATALVLEAVQKGLDASIVHPGGICGPLDYGPGHMTQLLMDYYKGKLTAGVHGGFDFVDVRDVASGVISCCRHGKAGECYILANRYISVRELLDVFHAVTGKRKIRLVLPLWLARISVPFYWIYYTLKGQRPLFSAYSLYTLSSNSAYSHEKARRELGYTVRPFFETVRDTVKWLKSEKKI